MTLPYPAVTLRALRRLDTADLLTQYAILGEQPIGRHRLSRTQRVHAIFDLLLDRARAGDALALAWLDRNNCDPDQCYLTTEAAQRLHRELHPDDPVTPPHPIGTRAYAEFRARIRAEVVKP